MGFFSRIKKLWGGSASDSPTPSAPQTPTPQPEPAPPASEAVAHPAAATPEVAGQPTPAGKREPSVAPQERDTPEAPVAADAPAASEKTSEPPLENTSQTASPHLAQTPPAAPHPAPEAAPKPKAPQPTPKEAEPHTAPEARRPSLWQRLWGQAPQDAPSQDEATPAAPKASDVAPALDFQEKPTIPAWQAELARALRDAEPRLSVWMEHILAGVTARGPELWARLRFLFSQLDAPESEAEDFIRRFDSWLSDMGYEAVEDFRSELQYRLALALDLEDEEDERSRLLLKLSQGLAKTRSQLTARIENLLARTSGYDAAFWEELEEILLVADVGVTATTKLLERLKKRVRQEGGAAPENFKSLLKEEIRAVFPPAPKPVEARPEVVLLVGVNGAGKTTTIAKLAHRAQMQGRRVLVAAGDTFRAAAIEQLEVWARRVGAGFHAKQHGADPAAVAFEAVERAQAEGYDLVLVDTAGRLQTKHNLMEELAKIARVLGKKLPGAPHRTALVLDATTGQNALSQARLFSQAAPVTEIILTKLDGTAKGGVIVGVALEFGIPISFVGLGEKMEDLRPFLAEEFAAALLGEQ